MNKKTIKRAVLKILWPFLHQTRSHLISRPFYGGIGSVLMFHRVCPDKRGIRVQGNSGLEVTPEYLENLILYLIKMNYDFVSLDTVHERLTEGYIGKKFIAFTFDDGYSDNLTFAYPILKKYDIPFTIYVATNYPDGGIIPWWYPLEDLIIKNKFLEFENDDKCYKFKCETLPEKEIVFHDIRNILMHSPQEQLSFKVDSFFRNHNIDLSEISEHYMLSWAQIQELNKSNLVNFGAHTVNHLALNKISKNDIRKEVLNSKLRLELKLQQSIDHFSYPFGSTEEVNEREFSIIKECGFKTATTTRWGNIFSEHKYHNECLPRIHINEKRDLRNVNFLSLSINGVIPCMVNKFKRVVTV